MQTILMWLDNLCIVPNEANRSFSTLQPEDDVHGGLRIQIGDRLIPSLGFFGPDDVCIPTWMSELGQVARLFAAGSDGCHCFDEGEQGQPAFEFRLTQGQCFFTIAESAFSPGYADPNWQLIEFARDDFLYQYTRLVQSVRKLIQDTGGPEANAWLEERPMLGLAVRLDTSGRFELVESWSPGGY